MTLLIFKIILMIELIKKIIIIRKISLILLVTVHCIYSLRVNIKLKERKNQDRNSFYLENQLKSSTIIFFPGKRKQNMTYRRTYFSR